MCAVQVPLSKHQASRRHNVVKEENAGGLSLFVVAKRVEAEEAGGCSALDAPIFHPENNVCT